MLVIRFQRAGRKKLPFYQIVVAEKHRPVKGRFIEKVGHYNPVSNPKLVELKKDRIEHWISKGATPSDAAARLFIKNGLKSAEKFVSERFMKPSKAELEAKQKEEEAKKAAQEAEAAKADEGGAEANEEETENPKEEAPSAEKKEG